MADRTHPKTLLAMSMSLLMMASATAAGRTFYVDDDGPADFNNIQAAIDDANEGDIIIVSPGTYTGDGNRDIDFLGKAITVRSTNPNDPNIVAATIIDCNGSGEEPHRGFFFHNGEDSNSVLDGFTIRNGYDQVAGGGIVCSSASPTIRNCIITNNRAEDDGGGIMCHAASPTIRNCIITRNRAEVWEGGGIRCRACRGAIIDNCLITENSARFGGGIGSSGDNSPIYRDIIVTNCTFSANSAKYGGGAVSVGDLSKPSMVNCILWGNTAPYGPEIVMVTLEWGARLYISFSDVQGGEDDVYGHVFYWGPGNIDSDPCFVQPGYWDSNAFWIDGNYHLLPTSLCINAGDPNYVAEPNETDLDGKPRIIGGRIDIGAYEYQPRDLYVNDDATGNNDGSSWLDAFNYLQDALNAAYSGDEIRVAQGVYKPDQGAGITPRDREAAFQLINGVTIKGGYAGFGEPDPDARDINLYETILTGDLNGDDVVVVDPCDLLTEPTRAENSYHVATGSGTTETAVLDGFTVTGGNADSLSFPSKCGGGMYNEQGSPTIADCTFSGNSASFGGAMYNGGECNPKFTNCTFIGNFARDNGGAMYNSHGRPTLIECTFSRNSATGFWGGDGGGMYNCWSNPILTNCTFTENSADYGGGMYNYYNRAILTNCKFSGNSASNHGGGMYNYSLSKPTLTNCTFSGNSAYAGAGMANEVSSPTITNCTFSGNSASRSGGGMYSRLPTSNPTLINCKFSANSAIVNGGGMSVHGSNPTLFNCTFTGNTSYRVGGAMECSGGYPTLTNCTFTGNTAGLYVGGMSGDDDTYPTLTNCMLWNNSDSGGMDEYAQFGVYKPQTTVNYSCIQGWTGALGGTGNIGDDPCFVKPGYWDSNGVWIDGDYHLLEGSPCIDAGDPNYIAEPNETDLDGRPRVIGGRIDMGAYESPISAEVRIVPRTINLTNRGKWITCYICLPEGYDVADIDPNSIFLEDEIQAVSVSVDEQRQVAIVRFSRSEVQGILDVGQLELTITGQLMDGAVFEATDLIRVLNKGDRKSDK